MRRETSPKEVRLDLGSHAYQLVVLSPTPQVAEALRILWAEVPK